MALPSTGPISLANVNVELGLSSTTNISLNQTSVRTLAGKASGTISMADLRGKSNSITLTIGYEEYDIDDGSTQYVGFEQGYQSGYPVLGSLSSNTFISSSTILELYYEEFTEYIDGSYSSYLNLVRLTVSPLLANSGWTTLTIGSTTWSRADAYYTALSFNNTCQWSWFYPSINPFAGGSTRTVSWS